MKKSILALTLLASVSISANAETVKSESVELCAAYSELAAEAMKIRQSNIPLAKVYKVVTGAATLELLKQAVKEPVWSTERSKKKAIDEFANEAFIDCITQMGERT